MASSYKEDNLPDLLPLYYNRLFPQALFHKWLCYGEPKNFSRREISFTLHGDIYLRYQTFETLEEFGQALYKKFPIKIDIGAVYKEPLNRGYTKIKTPSEREIVFDIDLTDYDEIRTCCSNTDVCSKCWKFMTIACKILDTALREDFNFQHLLWVFSGRRGIHCWIADKRARKFDDTGRASIAENLQLLKGGMISRRVKLPFKIHAALRRALKIIDQYFEKVLLIEQDILGNDERLTKFLSYIEDDFLKEAFNESLLKVNSSVERWKAFENTFQKLLREQKIPNSLKNMVEEMKLFYAYPRIDINVTKGTNHLLKAPFCVHPKTGKISVPFKAKFVDSFDLNKVPTISQLIDEVNEYDAKTKEQQGPESQASTMKIKDYKKTSLLKHVTILNEFLRVLEAATVKERAAQNGSALSY